MLGLPNAGGSSLCSEALDVCEEDMSPSQLYAFDPSNSAKDEL